MKLLFATGDWDHQEHHRASLQVLRFFNQANIRIDKLLLSVRFKVGVHLTERQKYEIGHGFFELFVSTTFKERVILITVNNCGVFYAIIHKGIVDG